MIRKLLEFVKSNQISFVGFCLVLDFILTVIIIVKVRYTEIDWIAYMQEVEGYLQGERNYSMLKGDTGPLVYPAGFVYVFVCLRYLTDNGVDIRQGQYIFAFFYSVVLSLTMFLYKSGKKVPVYVWPLLMLSKRIHSIFVLRLFNDCIAVLLGYTALVLFTWGRWKTGSVAYSLAVGVKMNMLLWAPGVLLVFLLGTGLYGTIMCLSICAIVQLLLGYPFLTTYPIEYIANSFNFGRQFMYEWTVNLKFLPEEVFLSKTLSLLLLALTVAAYTAFGHKIITANIKALTTYKNCKCKDEKKSTYTQTFKDLLMIGHIHLGDHRGLSSHFIISTVFISNFIGIVFARSMHYQFYCWYFHTIPYLLWTSDVLTTPVRLAIWIMIEVAFNVYPATFWSSGLLQIAHIGLLVALYLSPAPLCNEYLRIDESPSSCAPSSITEVVVGENSKIMAIRNHHEKNVKAKDE